MVSHCGRDCRVDEGTAIMDGARFHDPTGSDLDGQVGTGRFRWSSPSAKRIVAAVAALLVVVMIVTMTNVLPILATATGVDNVQMDHGQSGPAPSHSRMRF
jgi:hypothetical protein